MTPGQNEREKTLLKGVSIPQNRTTESLSQHRLPLTVMHMGITKYGF